MRFALVLLGFALACAPRNEREPPAPTAEYPAYEPPSGAIGQPGDDVVQFSTSGQWLAVCRSIGNDRVPKLLVGDDLELPLDNVGTADPVGRFVVVHRGGERFLYDAVLREEHSLGPIATTTWGSFDGQGTAFAYGRREDGRDVAVVRSLPSGEERIVESPVHPLTNVDLDVSGRYLWLKALEIEPHRPDTSNMCQQGGCEMGAMARGVGYVMLDLAADDPTFVTLDPSSSRQRAIDGAAVVETSAGIDLVSATDRVRIAPRSCTIEFDDGEAPLVLSCDEVDGRQEYALWSNGQLVKIGFARRGWQPPLDGFVPLEEVGIVRGLAGAWLALSQRVVVQGMAEHDQGYSWRDRVVLAGPGVGVEIRDLGRAETIAVIDVPTHIGLVRGPWVALNRGGRSDGWVVDLRTGGIVRTFESGPLELSRSGHVALRDEQGRIVWR